ncbi:MAG: di-trans,poly-cis-decaprenylcistransferase [Gammaproteobacteria bacterium]|nr:MAG: di-trans,poly-cis-decaprenylcistransferase [Gammaproteobacteria bacterium]
MTDYSEVPLEAPGIPRHVAIIMDGNNRWARQRHLPGVAGHKAGVDAVRDVVETCARAGIEVLTLFAFSSENWRRPKDEVSALMRLFLVALDREVKRLHRNNLRLRIIGDRSAFSQELQERMERAEALTAQNTGMTLVIAANYGGRWDMAQAARQVAEAVARGELSPDRIDESVLHRYTALADLPAPDLMIRTAGELRISNFMLWQLAYAEFYFADVFWPDFRKEEMTRALEAYSRRKRRFGQTDEQVDARRQGGELC